jgi:hypothetical protein
MNEFSHAPCRKWKSAGHTAMVQILANRKTQIGQRAGTSNSGPKED